MAALAVQLAFARFLILACVDQSFHRAIGWSFRRGHDDVMLADVVSGRASLARRGWEFNLHPLLRIICKDVLLSVAVFDLMLNFSDLIFLSAFTSLSTSLVLFIHRADSDIHNLFPRNRHFFEIDVGSVPILISLSRFRCLSSLSP